MSRESSTLWIAVLLAFGVVAGLWYYTTQRDSPEAPVPLPVTPAEPELPPIAEDKPLHPLPSLTESERPELRPLPNLDDSDEFLKLELADLFGPDLQPRLAESRIIERIVATVDNLPRKHVAERMRPVSGLAEQFVVDAGEASDVYVLNPDGYRRYDSIVGMLTAADINAMVSLYRRYYSLFQDAYVDLGYPNRYFNDRLVEVIGHLQETPQAEPPILLLRTHVLYQFADPELEQLSSGQKLLLRMGPTHAASVKAKLAELRNAIAEQ